MGSHTGKASSILITGTHSYIRGTESDDVHALSELYHADTLRAGLLDGRRERLLPSHEELRELLGRKEIAEGAFYTVEDTQGAIRGFCSLRGLNPEAGFCEYSLLLLDSATYASEIAEETSAVMLERAFVRLGLRKVVAHCLCCERDFAALLNRLGFTSAGVQRQVLYAGGAWQDLEAFERFAPFTQAA